MTLGTSSFALGLAQHYIELHSALAAIDSDLDSVAGAVVVHSTRDIPSVVDILAVNRHNEITTHHDWNVAQVCPFRTAFQPATVGSSAWDHALDQQAVIRCQAQLLSQF